MTAVTGGASTTVSTEGSATGRAERRGDREIFLDAIRTLALIRVVLWHATGAPPVTFLVAAVPTMFFVNGSLLAKSLRRGVLPVLRDRAQRILVPLWVFAAGAFATMAIAHAIDGTDATAVPWRNIVFWMLPVADPTGSQWEGGYMASPLWYLRALLWILLLSPVLLWSVRRTRGAVIGLSVATVFVLEWLARTDRWNGTWAWRFGDLALYATFSMLGFAHRDGRLAWLTRRRWAVGAIVSALAAAGWAATQTIPDGVVNDSHPAHLLVGFAWLGAFFAARPAIEQLARTRPVSAAIDWVSQRTLTIYLWHSTAIIVTYELLRRSGVSFPPGGWVVMLLTGTALVTSVFVLCFGWVEDTANHRVRHAWPVPKFAGSAAHVHRFASASAVAGALVLFASANATVFEEHRAEAAGEPATPRLRVPSRAPTVPVFVAPGNVAVLAVPSTPGGAAAPSAGVTADASSAVVAPPSPPVRAAFDATTVAALTTTIDRWMADNGAAGIEVAIVRPGSIDWSYGRGSDPFTGAAVGPQTAFDIESITKTFTATLVWQQVDRGTIDPDAPLPALVAVPELPAQRLTVRQLLSHSSGLVNYRDTPEYLADPGSIASPVAAVAASARQPLAFAPGTRVAYSSSNFLVLGLLLEQVTGQRYDTLLSGLVDGAGLGTVIHRPPSPGLPNFSTAGVTMSASQLARWGVALLRDNTPSLSPASLQAMRAISPGSGFGAGLIGYCPCTIRPDGAVQWSALGHTGGSSELQYVFGDDVAIALFVSDSIYEPEGRYDAVQSLIEAVRFIVDAGA